MIERHSYSELTASHQLKKSNNNLLQIKNECIPILMRQIILFSLIICLPQYRLCEL